MSAGEGSQQRRGPDGRRPDGLRPDGRRPDRRRHRSWALNVARIGTVVSAVMFAGNAAAALPLGDTGSGLVIAPSSGDSATQISLQILPTDRRCPGSDARWTSFLVPASLDPEQLRYDSDGPIGAEGAAVLALEAYAGGEELMLLPTGADGRLEPAPPIGFRFLAPGAVPDGRYRMGFACTRPAADGFHDTSRAWWFEMDVVGDDTGGPAEFRWRVGPEPRGATVGVSPTLLDPPSDPTPAALPPSARLEAGDGNAGGGAPSGPIGVVQDISVVVPGPTTTTSTTTTSSTTTTTIVGSAAATTTTIVAGGAATTIAVAAGGPTTTLIASEPGTPGVGSGGGGSGSGGTGGTGGTGATNRFPRTGSEVRGLLLWGLALVGFGRLAVVMGRRRERERTEEAAVITC